MPKETIQSRLDRFIENDFHHLALEVANLKGQVKIILMVTSLRRRLPNGSWQYPKVALILMHI